MKLPITLSLLIASTLVYAQSAYTELSHNNTRIGILNGGDFFWNLSSAQYQVPKVTNPDSAKRSTIFSGAVWIGGYDEGDKLHLAAMTYRQRGLDFQPGPGSSDTTTRYFYDNIYTVTAAEVAEHKKDPSDPPGSITDWPGNGDTTKGEPFQLAPFVDLNGNDVYEPLLGDYPKIMGLAAAYCVYNDKGVHTQSQGVPLNVDVHQLFYQDVFTYNGERIDDVNFARFIVVNRSETTYSDFIFGLYIDYDIGNFKDDYAGSDPSMNMTFAYNGADEDAGAEGYGYHPPAQGMILLNRPLGAAVAFNNDFSVINGNPTEAIHYYNYMDAKWKNGAPIEYGGNGITGTDGTPARFMYPFDTDSTHKNSNWNEKDAGNAEGDRRMLGSTRAITLAPGETVCYDVAFVYGRTATGDPEASVDVMKAKAGKVQDAYDKNMFGWKSTDCVTGSSDSGTLGMAEWFTDELNGKVYPNPASRTLYIDLDARNYTVEISNARGQVVLEQEIHDGNASALPLDIPDGIYFVRVVSRDGRVFMEKLIKH